jgi:non-specific serine/threonine protein kinase
MAGARLLTLTGVGGCGKTRLAIEVSRAMLGSYADGSWLVELAPLEDPQRVPLTVASVLGIRELGGQSLTATVAQRLRDRQLLLVVDNCEHLLDACASIADAILRACPEVRILATSREPLGLTGEVAWLVPSLAVPDRRQLPPIAELGQMPAVQLFVERAKDAEQRFTLTDRNAAAVAHICQQLDGIPLALELAAARMQGLSAERLASRLDEAFRLLTGGSRTALPRQQTLQATLDWSFTLLTEAERRLFARLSIFAGGWTVEAAEEVCSAGCIAREDVLELLLRLVRKSLVDTYQLGDGTERYRLLETLRQYARDQAVAADELQRLQRRHADYFLAFNTALHPPRPERSRWFRWPKPSAS